MSQLEAGSSISDLAKNYLMDMHIRYSDHFIRKRQCLPETSHLVSWCCNAGDGLEDLWCLGAERSGQPRGR